MVFYIVGALALLARGTGVRLPYIAGALLLVGNVYLYSEIPLRDRGSLRMVVLDVRHGSCVFVEFPNGRTMLYDAGTRGYFDVGWHVIAPFLWQRGVRKIDLVVVSHEDADHFDALPFLMERFGVGRVLVNDHLLSSEEGRPLVDFIGSRGIKVEVVQEGVELNGLGGA
ncbi:MAG: ComEC/Rec2 family competence protein, partial [Candidatus Brocadiales bacterium]